MKRSPPTDAVFAARITGSGANTELEYVGSYTHLREDIIEWDNDQRQTRSGCPHRPKPAKPSDLPTGFNIEGVEFAARLEDRSVRHVPRPARADEQNAHKALMIPVTNFGDRCSSTATPGHQSDVRDAMEWNMPNRPPETEARLSIRQISATRRRIPDHRRPAISKSRTVFAALRLGRRTGRRTGAAEQRSPRPDVAEGAWECDHLDARTDPQRRRSRTARRTTATPNWYESGTQDAEERPHRSACRRTSGACSRSRSRAPGPPEAAAPADAAPTPTQAKFTIHWKPAPTLRARFTLQHQNAERRLDHGGQQPHQAANTPSNRRPRGPGTTASRRATKPLKADSRPNRKRSRSTARRRSRRRLTPNLASPTYAGKGGWYKDTRDGLLHRQRGPDARGRKLSERRRTRAR